jgi:hypothetical protein
MGPPKFWPRFLGLLTKIFLRARTLGKYLSFSMGLRLVPLGQLASPN